MEERYRRAEVLWRRVGDRCLVHYGSEVHELRGGAAALWIALDIPHSIIEIVDAADPTKSAESVDLVTESIKALVYLRVVASV